MALEGGERLILKTLRDLQGDSTDYVDDTRLASATKMFVEDVRDLLEMLEGKGFVERVRAMDGFRAYITAKGKLELRLTEPVANPKSGTAVSAASDVAALSVPDPSTPTNPGVVASKSSEPISVFFSYSHEDEPLRNDLAKHLTLLKRQGVISAWHDRMITAGDEWKGEIDKNLEKAQVILLFVSASFIASDYCFDIETKRAVERHDLGDARVIPVLIRPCDWKSALFARLTALPTNWKAVTSWPNQDEAWTDVALGIRRAVEAMTPNPR